MNTASEAIRKLLLAHFQSDEAAFRTAALKFVENERRLNHHTLANNLADYHGFRGDDQMFR